MPDKPKVLIIGTGGTISGKMTPDGSIASGQFGAEEFLLVAPEIQQVADINTMGILRLDSSDMHPEHWMRIVDVIARELPHYDGFVVTHGVDTMQYTAAAVAFALQGLDKPIVFTGSQLPIHFVASDARRNLAGAVQVAAQADLAEVCIVFDGLIFRAVRTRRIKAIETDAFASLGIDPIGIIRNRLALSGHHIPRNQRKLQIQNSFDPAIGVLPIFPGILPTTVEQLIQSGIKALLLIGYGLGYVPTESAHSLLPAIQSATDAAIPVIVASQAAFGHYEVGFYEVGKPLKQAGALSAHDMLWETLLVKLMWILGQNPDRKQFETMLGTNYAGEMIGPLSGVDK